MKNFMDFSSSGNTQVCKFGSVGLCTAAGLVPSGNWSSEVGRPAQAFFFCFPLLSG